MDNIPYYLESLIILSVVTVDSTEYSLPICKGSTSAAQIRLSKPAEKNAKKSLVDGVLGPINHTQSLRNASRHH
jgi:hypothetical protein